MNLTQVFGMRVVSSSLLPADAVLMVRNGEALHRFIWSANALADQELEIERLRAEVERLTKERDEAQAYAHQAYSDLAVEADNADGMAIKLLRAAAPSGTAATGTEPTKHKESHR